MGPKKLSGSEFRKLKKEREKTATALSGKLGDWLVSKNENRNYLQESMHESDANEEMVHSTENDEAETSGSFSNTQSCVEDEASSSRKKDSFWIDEGECLTTESSLQVIPTSQVTDRSDDEIMNIAIVTDEPTEKCSQKPVERIVYEDPVKWPGVPEITDSVRLQIVDHGPEIVILSTFKFPDSDGGRHLDAKWFYKTLTNGERVKRQWVIYSALFLFSMLTSWKKSEVFSLF